MTKLELLTAHAEERQLVMIAKPSSESYLGWSQAVAQARAELERRVSGLYAEHESRIAS